MDSQTVPQLKTLAKNLGLRGYSRLRKAELINLINQNLPRGVVNFIDEDDTKPITQVSRRQPSPSPTRRKKRQPSPHPLEQKAEDSSFANTIRQPKPKRKRNKKKKNNQKEIADAKVSSYEDIKPSTDNKRMKRMKRMKREVARLTKKINRARKKKYLQQKREKVIKKIKNFQPEKNEEPSQQIEFIQRAQALAGYTKSYEVGLTKRQEPLIQLQKTRLVIENNLSKVLNEMKGFKFNEVLKITFEKQKGDELIEKTAYFNEKVQTITNETEIAEFLHKTQEQIVNKIQQWISEG